MPVSRLFTEIGKEVDRMNQSLRQAVTTAEQAGVKVQAAGRTMIASFDQALNPTKALGEQIKLLEAAGKSQADIQKVLGAQIAETTRRAKEMGQPIDELVKKYTSLESRLKSAGDNMMAFGRQMSMYVTAPILAIGAAAFKAGDDYEKAIDRIRAGTGATGSELASLGSDMEAIWGTIPQSAEAIGSAIADLNTRLGLSGKPLQELATQVLNLSRITHTDLNPLIAASTRLFGDWSVASANQSKSLDYMFKVSQQTGIGIQQLMEVTVQYGAPLRALGFSLEQGAAMMGKWEKEGVNMETVLAGLRYGLGQMAKASQDPVEALTSLIEKIQGARSESEATAIAFKAFGQRAAVDMGRAILEGRLNVDDLIKSLKDSKDTINAAAQDTLNFADRMKILKESTEKALLPLGEELLTTFENLEPLLKNIVGHVGDLAKAFSNLDPFLQKVVLGSIGLAAALGPVAIVVGAVARGISSLMGLIAGAGGAAAVLTSLGTAAAGVGVAFGAWKLAEWVDGFDLLGRHAAIAEDAILHQANALAEQAKAMGVVDENLVKYRDLVASGQLKLPDIFKQQWGESAAQFRDRMQELIDKFKLAHPEAGVLGTAIDTIGGNAAAAGKATSEVTETLDHFLARLKTMGQEATETSKLLDQLTIAESDLKDATEKLKQADDTAGRAKIENLSKHIAELKILIQLSEDNAKFAVSDLRAEEDMWKRVSKEIKEAVDQIDKYRQAGTGLGHLGILPSILYQPVPRLSSDDIDRMTKAIMNSAVESAQVMDDAWIRSWEDIQKQALKNVENIRNAAGHIFDDLMAGSKDIFRDLLDAFKNIFLAPVRIIFQNLSQWIFAGSKPTGGILGGAGLGTIGGLAAGGILGASVAGLSSGNAYATAAGGIGLGIAGGGAAISAGLIPGMGAASLSSAMTFLATNPWTIGIAAGIMGAVGLKKLLSGKSSEQAGSMEVSRDLGGISYGKEDFKSFYESLGLTEKTSYDIRKDLIVSPKFLVEQAAPIAEATGKMNEFLKSLETVQTSWGTFNFREAFELGQATGDWTELNKQFQDAFEHSGALAENLPDWEKLLAASAAAIQTANDLMIESFTSLRDAIQDSITPIETMYDKFLTTGEITEELRSQIELLGGSIEGLQKMSDLNLQISGLHSTLDFIGSLKSAIGGLAKELDPIEQLMSGVMGKELTAALQGAGLDPAKFTNLTKMIGLQDKWENNEAFGTLTPELREALLTYGGAGGSRAVERYGQGFNTITQSLLDSTKAAMDEAYYSAITEALDYLGEQEKQVTDQLQELISAVNDAKQDVVNMLDNILGTLSSSSATSSQNIKAPGTQTLGVPVELDTNYDIPMAAGGGLVRVHDEEAILDPEQTRNLMRGGNQASVINIYNPVFNGWDDFVEQVRRAGLVLDRRGAW